LAYETRVSRQSSPAGVDRVEHGLTQASVGRGIETLTDEQVENLLLIKGETRRPFRILCSDDVALYLSFHVPGLPQQFLADL
jgi:hypothetical protein